MAKFRHVARHAGVLNGGRPVAPGEVVALTADQERANRSLIDRGLLLAVSTKKKAAVAAEEE